jgi:hypothetical protein
MKLIALLLVILCLMSTAQAFRTKAQAGTNRKATSKGSGAVTVTTTTTTTTLDSCDFMASQCEDNGGLPAPVCLDYCEFCVEPEHNRYWEFCS